jgi:hypothetical protein
MKKTVKRFDLGTELFYVLDRESAFQFYGRRAWRSEEGEAEYGPKRDRFADWAVKPLGVVKGKVVAVDIQVSESGETVVYEFLLDREDIRSSVRCESTEVFTDRATAFGFVKDKSVQHKRMTAVSDLRRARKEVESEDKNTRIHAKRILRDILTEYPDLGPKEKREAIPVKAIPVKAIPVKVKTKKAKGKAEAIPVKVKTKKAA